MGTIFNLCMQRLENAYKEGAKVGNYLADHTEFDKIKQEYPDIAHQVAIAWWGN